MTHRVRVGRVYWARISGLARVEVEPVDSACFDGLQGRRLAPGADLHRAPVVGAQATQGLHHAVNDEATCGLASEQHAAPCAWAAIAPCAAGVAAPLKGSASATATVTTARAVASGASVPSVAGGLTGAHRRGAYLAVASETAVGDEVSLDVEQALGHELDGAAAAAASATAAATAAALAVAVAAAAAATAAAAAAPRLNRVVY